MRLREIARDRGWSLSEHGFARIGEDGEVIEGAGAERRTFATEEEVYDFLGLPFIRARDARGPRRDRGRAGGPVARPGDASRTSRATATPTPSGRTAHDPIERMGGGGAATWLRVPGPDRPLPEPDDRQRADAGAGGAAAPHHRRAQRELCPRGGGWRSAEGSHPDGFRLLHGLRDGDPRRRPARLRRQAPGPLRRRGRIAPRRAAPAAGAADGALP